MADSDGQLLNRAVVGDQDALGVLITRHAPEVRRTLAGKIAQRWQATLSIDDVMQETFADAIVSITGFRPQGERAFVRWLTTLARNNLLRAVEGLSALKRGGKSIRVQPTEDSYLSLFESMGGTTTSPSVKAAREEAKAAIDRCFAMMPKAYRMVVSLYDLAGCSVEDTCEACECSPGAMFMRRARALAMLRELIGRDSQS